MTQFIKVDNIFSVAVYDVELDGFAKLFLIHSLFKITKAEVEDSMLRLKETNLLSTIPKRNEQTTHFELKPIPKGSISFQDGKEFTELPVEEISPEHCFTRLLDLIYLHEICKIEVTEEKLHATYHLRKEGVRLERFLYEAKLMN